MANITLNNWSAIALDDFSILDGVDTFDSELDSILSDDPTITSRSNSQITGSWDGWPFVMTGSGFNSGNPVINQFSMTSGSNFVKFAGSLNLNMGGTLTSYSVKLGTDQFAFSGAFQYNFNGDFIGGTIKSFNVTESGFKLSMSGSIDLDVADNLTGTVTSFTFQDPSGHKLAVSGISMDAQVVDDLSNTDLGHTNLTDLFNALDLSGNDSIVSGGASDAFSGGEGNDSLNGGAGNDTLDGGGGNDTLYGGTGADNLSGSDGNDTYIVDLIKIAGTPAIAALQDNISENINAGIDTVSLRGTITLTTPTTLVLDGSLANIENLDASATTTTKLNLTGNDLNNILTGNAAANILIGELGDDTLNGGAGNDTLSGGDGDDTLNGGVGNDSLVDGLGNNTASFMDTQKNYEILIKDLGTLSIRDLNLTNGNEGTDILSGIQKLHFSDGDITFSPTLGPNQYQLNTTTSGSQTKPLILPSEEGGYLATWVSGVAGIYGQFYGADNNKLGDEFLLTTRTGTPSIAKLADGDFIVTTNAKALHFNDDGTAIGSEVQVNTYGPSPSGFKVASLADGGYVIVWQSDDAEHPGYTNPDNNGYGIYAQLFDTSDNKVGDEFRVNTYINGTQSTPAVAGLADGSFVVTWQSVGQDASGTFGIYAQRFNGDGSNIGGEYRVNIQTAGDQINPSIVPLLDGSLIVVWVSDAIKDGDIYGQHLTADGVAIGDQFKVNNTENFVYSSSPTVTALTNGDYVVTWKSKADAFDLHEVINGQIFSTDGDKVGDQFVVNTQNPTQGSSNPLVTALMDGGFIVTWNALNPSLSGADDSEVYARRFTADGHVYSFDVLTGNAASNLFNMATAIHDLNLQGMGGKDTLISGMGNDILNGGQGTDSLVGGAGHDEYIVDSTSDKITEKANNGIDSVRASATYMLSANLENLTLTGLANINGTGNTLANEITGNDTNNLISGLAGNDTLDGGAGNDTLDGGAEVDSLIGGEGNDTYTVDLIKIGTGALATAQLQDTINESSNEGTDTINLKGSVTTLTTATTLVLDGLLSEVENINANATTTTKLNLTGNALNNILTGNAAANILTGNEGNDSLVGGSGNDTLSGGDDDDTLAGGTGADTMMGGTGNDVYIVDNVKDVVIESYSLSIDTALTSFDPNVTATSPDGNFIAFETSSSLVPHDLGSSDVYIKNLTTGEYQRVSENANGTAIGWSNSDPSFSSDGHLVMFVTSMYDVEICIKDLQTGELSYVARVADLEHGYFHPHPLFSPDGNFVMFQSEDAGLVAHDTNSVPDIFIRNIATGSSPQRVSTSSTGAQAVVSNPQEFSFGSEQGSFSHDSQSIIFTSEAKNLVAHDTNARTDIFMKNLTTGLVTRLSESSTGQQANGNSGGAIFSPDDRFVAFSSGASNLVANDTNGVADVFVKDLWSGTIIRVSTAADGTQGNNEGQLIFGDYYNGSDLVAFSADGQIIFSSHSSNLVENDTNHVADYFMVKNPFLLGEYGEGGIDRIESSISFNLALKGSGIENLTLTGTGIINGTGNHLDNIILGNAAANILDGGAGTDTMAGGKGNDTYLVDDAGDVVTEALNEGADAIWSSVTYSLVDTDGAGSNGNNVENLKLLGYDDIDGTGNVFANTIIGNAGDNILDGGDGTDTLKGGLGDDTYIVDLKTAGTGTKAVASLQDSITETANAGNDTIELRGSAVLTKASTITLGANVENLDASATGSTLFNLTGNKLDNTLIGNDADNILNGGAGFDTLNGGDGNDTLIGGTEGDWLTGGLGGDIFDINEINQAYDVITDFNSAELDRIDLSTIDANTKLAGNQSFSFIGVDTAFSHVAGQLSFNSVSHVLYGDVNGDLQPDFGINLFGVTTLANSDFIL